MERINRDTYRLSSGREVQANHGLISIAADVAKPLGYGADAPFAGFELGEGYDGSFSVDCEGEEWTPEELEELAEFMIEQWQRFKGAICAATKQHDWAPWRGLTNPFTHNPVTGEKWNEPREIDQRFCRRCLVEETAPAHTHTS